MQREAWAFPRCQRAEASSPELPVGWERHRPGGSPWVSRMAATAGPTELWASWQYQPKMLLPVLPSPSELAGLRYNFPSSLPSCWLRFNAGQEGEQRKKAGAFAPVLTITPHPAQSHPIPFHPVPSRPSHCIPSNATVMQPGRGTRISPRWRIPQMSLPLPNTCTPLAPRAAALQGLQGRDAQGRAGQIPAQSQRRWWSKQRPRIRCSPRLRTVSGARRCAGMRCPSPASIPLCIQSRDTYGR